MTVGGQSVDSRWTAGGQPVDSRWTVGGQWVDSRWTPGGQSVDSRWTVGGQSVDSRWTVGYSWQTGRVCLACPPESPNGGLRLRTLLDKYTESGFYLSSRVRLRTPLRKYKESPLLVESRTAPYAIGQVSGSRFYLSSRVRLRTPLDKCPGSRLDSSGRVWLLLCPPFLSRLPLFASARGDNTQGVLVRRRAARSRAKRGDGQRAILM